MPKHNLNQHTSYNFEQSTVISKKLMLKWFCSHLSSPKKIIAVLFVAVIIGFTVWDFVDAPPFWHFRQADKKVILEYQSQHYPGAKVVKSNFPLLGNPSLVGVPVESSMTFEYDGVEFVIAAQDGELKRDYFPFAKAKLKIVNVIDEFIKTHGIENEGNIKIDVIFDLLHVKSMLYPFDEPPTEDLSKYNHRVDIEIIIKGEYNSPKDVGWLYDCYKYWIIENILPNYSLTFKVVSNNEVLHNACFYNDYEVSSESAFYSSFMLYQ